MAKDLLTLTSEYQSEPDYAYEDRGGTEDCYGCGACPNCFTDEEMAERERVHTIEREGDLVWDRENGLV